MAEQSDLFASPRHANTALRRREIPAEPGVYAWFKNAECIYIGVATSLRNRLGTHRRQTADLSRSTLRASVAVMLFGVTRARARSRPSVMTPDEIAAVNAWFTDTKVAWIESATADDARVLERSLLENRLPPLNLK